MKYRPPLTADEATAYLSMPKNADGFVVNLFFVPGERERLALEAAWRDWARTMPKHLHPNWFPEWAEYKRSGVTPSYVGRMR